uniref:Saposin B-type domain-containing protein n=1 Tax=Strix occidentalis caurina TaxID=311401 RepID=A0A8D0FYP5_STROC
MGTGSLWGQTPGGGRDRVRVGTWGWWGQGDTGTNSVRGWELGTRRDLGDGDTLPRPRSPSPPLPSGTGHGPRALPGWPHVLVPGHGHRHPVPQGAVLPPALGQPGPGEPQPLDAAVEAALGKACRALGKRLSRLCKGLVKKYREQLSEALQNGDEPRDTCAAIGFCKA